MRRTWIDGEADRAAAQAQRVADAGGEGLGRIGIAAQGIGVVDLQDQRDLACEGARAGLDEAQRRGIGVAPRLHGQAEMIERIIGRRIGRERTRRAVLEALVDRKDHQLARAGEGSVVEQPGQVGDHAG